MPGGKDPRGGWNLADGLALADHFVDAWGETIVDYDVRAPDRGSITVALPADLTRMRIDVRYAWVAHNRRLLARSHAQLMASRDVATRVAAALDAHRSSARLRPPRRSGPRSAAPA